MPELDYERDTSIDENSLDVEWLDQARMALRYSKHVAQLRRKLRRLDELKKTIRSELIQEANANPERCCNKEKPNASDIEAYYRTNKRYRKVIKKLLKAEYELEYAEFARFEIAVTRKKALEYAVILHGQNYFAGPSVPRDLTREVERRRRDKEISKGIAEKLGTKKRKKKT